MYNKKKRHNNKSKPHYHRNEEDNNQKDDNTTQNTEQKDESASSKPKNEQDSARTSSRRNRRRRNKSRNKNRPTQDQQQLQNNVQQIRKDEDISDVVFPDELIPEIERNKPEGQVICPICNSVIKNVTIAISHHETKQPAHFDCVLKQLRQQNRNKLGKNRKVYYIGNGSFAVVKERYDKKGRFRNYHVIERIEYENRED